MRIVLWPFCSQQNKKTDKFLLQSDSGVKMYFAIAKEAIKRGHVVQFVKPPTLQCQDDVECVGLDTVRQPWPIPLSNLDRRFHCDVPFLRSLACDLLLTTHETLAFPFKHLHPNARVVLEAMPGLLSTNFAMNQCIALNWSAADALHCNSRLIADRSEHNVKHVWRFGYDDALARPHNIQRDVDVVFPARCSATNYSHHIEYLNAMYGSNHIMTDPTCYLSNNALYTREEYESLLHSSKVVVGLTDNGYGGFAFIEAVAAGCCPVALRCAEYEELLTPEWPYFCTLKNIRQTVDRALELGWRAVESKTLHTVNKNIAACAYSRALVQAVEDLKL